MKKNIFLINGLLLLLAVVFPVFAQSVSIKLNVDATDAARSILRVRETMAVKPGGEFTLFYPKWIPGEHAPTGKLNNMANLFITANGKPVEWRRDDVEMFAFHLTIPAGVEQIEVAFDDVSEPGTTAGANLARIKWNRLVLYPKGLKSDDVKITASMKIPDGWQHAVALPVARETKNAVDFKSVNLTTLVDSPAVIGKYFKKIPLSDAGGVLQEMDIAAETAEALNYEPETLAGWKNLIKEADLMFGARHFGSYKFLLTLSDQAEDEGLEHHESSENGVGETALSDSYHLLGLNELLAHEYAHSWNGKYRRPVGLMTGDFETPMKAELLWIYEGLTQHLGRVLPVRSRLWTPETFREAIAAEAARLDSQSGRRWRPLADTTRAVQFTYDSPGAWRNQRRGADYYDEGALIWLEADVLIRRKSGNKLSLDDFTRRFHGGGQNTGVVVKTYDLDEVVRTLNDITPHDWRGFFNERVYTAQKRAPLGGITEGGWQLIYNETPNLHIAGSEENYSYINALYSIGIQVDSDGAIDDVHPEMPGWRAGLAPGMKITRINDEEFSFEQLRKAIAETKNNSPIVLTAGYGNLLQTYKLVYKGGERYPHLVRDVAKPDLLSDIIKPH